MIDVADATVDKVVEQLEAEGYVAVRGMLEPAKLAEIRTDLLRVLEDVPPGRNFFEGSHTRRIYAVFAKTRTLDGPAIDPLVLGVVERIIGHAQLSAPTGIAIDPGEAAQILHHDDSIYPLFRPHQEIVLNTMWALDDFTVANGATRIVEGSHRWVDRQPKADEPTIAAEMPAGSVLFYNGSIWHGGGANTTDTTRLGVILEYAASWVRQQENHLLAVPRATARQLPERLQELLGYNIRPPFIGYVDGRHPLKALESADD